MSAQIIPFPGDHDGLKWLDDAACAEMDLDDFFVAAGHTISERVLNTCRGCPVRRDCLVHAYDREIDAGYLGGLSPSQRRNMPLKDALRYIANDPPKRSKATAVRS